tara:strand:+ start:49 stop:477 length:429 start_codon:yes stop_codon:yes gene_type:complete
MAHPYKQKYNNFNGPGHESPAPYIGAAYKTAKNLIWKPIKNLFKRSPKSTKFVPIDSPKGWKKIQEQIGKRYVDDAGKIKKMNVAKDVVIYPTLYYQSTDGEAERKMYDRNEVAQDNTAVDPGVQKELNTKQNQKSFMISNN